MKFSMIFGALALAGAATASQAQDFTMRIAAGTPSSDFACTDFLKEWAEKIKAESDGRIGYQLFCDGVLGRMGDTIARVEQGVADVGWDIPLVYGQRFASYGVVGVPKAFDDPSKAAGALWTLHEQGKLAGVEGSKLAMVQVMDNVGLWLKESDDLSDLDGSKIALGSKVRGTLVDAMNGVPVAMRLPGYYQAISKGAADGALTSTAAAFGFSLDEVANQNVHGQFGGGIVFVTLNESFYDGLPDDLKAVIDNNIGYEASKWASSIIKANEVSQMTTALEAGSITSRPLNDTEQAAWAPAFEEATGTWVSGVENGADILDSFRSLVAEETAY